MFIGGNAVAYNLVHLKINIRIRLIGNLILILTNNSLSDLLTSLAVIFTVMECFTTITTVWDLEYITYIEAYCHSIPSNLSAILIV